MSIIARTLGYMREPHHSRSRRVRALIVVAAWVSYIAAYAPIAAVIGDGAAILTALPVVVSAWAFGVRGGLAAAVASMPLNMALASVVYGHSPWDLLRGGRLFGFTAVLAVGAATGWPRGMMEIAEQEIVERKQAQRQLNDAKIQLEQRVTARTKDLSESNERLVDEVAERIQAEEGLYQRTAELEALFQIANVLSQPGTFNEKAARVLKELAQISNTERLVLRMVDQESQELRAVATEGFDVSILEPVSLASPDELAHNLSLLSVRMGEVVVENDYPASPHARPELIRQGVRSMMVLPISNEERLLGTFSLNTVKANHFSADMVRLLNAVANALGPFLDSASLIGQVQATNQQLEETLVQLQRTQGQVIRQERLRAIGTMASGIAHDFNNELTPILGFSQLLLNDPSRLNDETQALRYLGMISDSAERAANVVARLREFYRYREDADVLKPIHLHNVVKNAIAISKPMWKVEAQHGGTTIEMLTDLQATPLVAGDQTELESAILNLILNALDAMPDGGSIIISTHFEPDDATAVLRIRDTGLGMTEEVRRQCLEPFFSTKGERGTGMGLAMVYGITDRHKGTLIISSAPGEGTTVTIGLPALQTGNHPVEDELPDESSIHPLRPLHILVVDDEPVVSQLIFEYLSADGHIVETARSGHEALQRFGEEEFDLVLTDQAMPEMSGEQLAASIKRVRPETRVLLLTGFGDMMHADSREHADIDLIVGKPVTVTHLRQAIKEVTAIQA